jgi:hypothetical protein
MDRMERMRKEGPEDQGNANAFTLPLLLAQPTD